MGNITYCAFHTGGGLGTPTASQHIFDSGAGGGGEGLSHFFLIFFLVLLTQAGLEPPRSLGSRIFCQIKDLRLFDCTFGRYHSLRMTRPTFYVTPLSELLINTNKLMKLERYTRYRRWSDHLQGGF